MKKNLNRFTIGSMLVTSGLVPGIALLTFMQFTSKNDASSLANYQGILWQTTAERRAGFLTQYSQAQRQFDDVINNKQNREFLSFDSVVVKSVSANYEVEYHQVPKDKFIPVVMVDLDETFLDNTPYQVFLALQNQRYDIQTWHQWVSAEQAKIYDGVLNFVKYVWSKGAMVFFSSNRNQGALGGNKTGDELKPTRQTLMNQGYPQAFLDSHVWWMQGALQASDHEQSATNLAKMKHKEQRFNYLNDINTRINPQSWAQMGINIIDEQLPSSRDFKDMAVQIVMRMGDDLNDFNDNLTKGQGQAFKHHYLDNTNIKSLFGSVQPRISFKNEDDKILQYYYQNAQNEWKIDPNLRDLKIVDEIIYEQLPFTPQETYTYITGNNMYGGWTDQYAQNFEQIKKGLLEYWKTAHW